MNIAESTLDFSRKMNLHVLNLNIKWKGIMYEKRNYYISVKIWGN